MSDFRLIVRKCHKCFGDIMPSRHEAHVAKCTGPVRQREGADLDAGTPKRARGAAADLERVVWDPGFPGVRTMASPRNGPAGQREPARPVPAGQREPARPVPAAHAQRVADADAQRRMVAQLMANMDPSARVTYTPFHAPGAPPPPEEVFESQHAADPGGGAGKH